MRLKVTPTPRTRGAIPTMCNTPILRYSSTPSLRLPGFEDEDENGAPTRMGRINSEVASYERLPYQTAIGALMLGCGS
jgi:hypothetical protein